MAGNSVNLIELMKGYLTGDFKNKLSSLLGESEDKTQFGLNAALPGILLGLDNAASTTDGSRRFSTAIDNAAEGLLSNIGSIFPRSSLTDIGPIQSILGAGGLSELTGNIGRTSGLSGKAVSAIIGFLAPVIFGMFKKLKQSRGLDTAGLLSLLSSQRSNIEAAMPEAMRETPVETHGGPRPVPHAKTTETYSNVEREPHGSSAGWILLLALLAG